MNIKPSTKTILPEFFHEEIDKNFNDILKNLPPRIEPQGFLTSFALVNADLKSVTIKWHGLAEDIPLTEIGKKYLIEKYPLEKSDTQCGLIWLVLDNVGGNFQRDGLEKYPDKGFYRVENPSEGPLKEYFIPVADQRTYDSFLMPLFDLERKHLIGIVAVDSSRRNIFNPKSDNVTNLVSFFRFLEIVVNSMHIAYYDLLCADMGVYSRNYLLYILKNIKS